ncbi:hypothetical protein B0H63DRAFT_468101 [Podospora didyma]|uniref:Uncharacterized protein n=1 Tax=Podospora didyma TaxID=330526 RepID=A0AAE0U0N3_9PEZI|nr:hypothetical protein B0H63DRAFT_468101 [Podospora didyma]
MEEVKPAFKGEPKRMPQDENRPPKRPEKIPIDDTENKAGAIPMEKMRKHYNHEVKRTERRASDSFVVIEIDSAEVKMGQERERSERKQDQRSAMCSNQWPAGYWPQSPPQFQSHHSHFPPAPPPHAYHSRDFASRLVQSSDDIDVDRRTAPRGGKEDQSFRQEIERLRGQLRDANSRAEQAERAAEELQKRLRSRSQEAKPNNGRSTDAIESLRSENKDLRAELDDARSHIFSLQPYRRDLTPEEVGRDFDDLVNNITDWVTKFMEPILDDDSKADEVLTHSRKRPAEAQRLRKCITLHGDLINGCQFPDTDIDLIVAIVMRFLLDNIFQKTLFGVMPQAVELINFIEASMRNNVEPKRDLFALRTWQAEALNALICTPEYRVGCTERTRELTIELATMFKPFRKEKDHSQFCCAWQDNVVIPAVRLNEKLLISTHHFYLDLNPFMVWNSSQTLETSPDFVNNLHRLRCENILQNRKPFNVDRLDPRPDEEELHKDLLHVVNVVPALYMRQIGRGDVIKAPMVIRKQQVLVAWGSQERKEKFMENSQRTLIHRLYYTPLSREKQERGFDGGGLRAALGAWAT